MFSSSLELSIRSCKPHTKHISATSNSYQIHVSYIRIVINIMRIKYPDVTSIRVDSSYKIIIRLKNYMDYGSIVASRTHQS
jgi:hypothetical protein